LSLSFSEALQTHWQCARLHPQVKKSYVRIWRYNIKCEYILLNYSTTANTMFLQCCFDISKAKVILYTPKEILHFHSVWRI